MNTMLLETDVRLAMTGDRDAYARIVEQSANVVCAIALAIVRNVQASEDVAQEVFLAVWTSLGKLRNPASFLPWLRQMTRNQANLWIRNHARERTDDDALAAAVDARPTADDLLLRDEERRSHSILASRSFRSIGTRPKKSLCVLPFSVSSFLGRQTRRRRAAVRRGNAASIVAR